MQHPALSDYLFWDTDKNLIDWQKQSGPIIIRVLERGTLEDLKEIRRYYGDKKIKEIIIKVRYLLDKTLSFVSLLFIYLNPNLNAAKTSLTRFHF